MFGFALLFIFCFWLYFALIVIVALVYLQFTVYAEIIFANYGD